MLDNDIAERKLDQASKTLEAAAELAHDTDLSKAEATEDGDDDKMACYSIALLGS